MVKVSSWWQPVKEAFISETPFSILELTETMSIKTCTQS